jgi:TPP-dependent pyruvate/acetoin dehydrogenase alpha subunit
LADLYYRMWLIRYFDENAKRLYQQDKIRGTTHSYIGEEAIAVGACAALNRDDYITSTHRGHGHCLAKGGDPRLMMAELLGKATGYCKGKGGSMHIADLDLGILGANGIGSGGLPISTGAALSAKMRGTGQVAVCFFGDGATAEGSFHEALNLASLWQVPLLFVCQNNLYGLSQPWQQTAYKCELALHARTYNMPASCVDGMDAIAVYRAAKEAVDRARAGGGPSFIEAKTYRFLGHYVGDPGLYMPPEERKAWRERDAILKLGAQLRQWGYLTEQEDEAMAASVEDELQAGVEFARSSPIPPPEAALDDVYVHFDYAGNPIQGSPQRL